MSLRGKITSIEIEIEYPDGTTKSERIDSLPKLQAVYFDDEVMNDSMKEIFTKSDDWRNNPAMILQYEDQIKGACNIAKCMDDRT